MKAWMAVVGVIALFAIIYVGSAFSYRGACVRAEAGIKGQFEGNKSSYDAMWKTVKELSQVPEMYVEDMKKLWDVAIQGRYGKDGSKAVVQFITEHNPTLDPTVYTKIQSAIEAGRTRFNADQQQLVDKKREYEVILNSNRAVFVGLWFDFPRINLDDFKIVTSDATDAAFATGKADEIKLRP